MAKREIIRPSKELDTGSELTLIPGVTERHCGSPVRVRAYEDQVINGELSPVCLIVGPEGPHTHTVAISPFQDAYLE